MDELVEHIVEWFEDRFDHELDDSDVESLVRHLRDILE